MAAAAAAAAQSLTAATGEDGSLVPPDAVEPRLAR